MIEMTEKEFNKQYPNWVDIDENGNYTNLPKEKFLLTSDTIVAEEIRYIAIDNSDNCCWVEDFKTREEAISYLENKE